MPVTINQVEVFSLEMNLQSIADDTFLNRHVDQCDEWKPERQTERTESIKINK